MATPREKLATKAKIGTFEFLARRVTRDRRRRIVRYTGIKVDGAKLDDLGEPPRVEVLEATLNDEQINQLNILMTAAKVYTMIHPLFGSFQGRIEGLKAPIGPKPDSNIVIELIEDGETDTIAAEGIAGILGSANKLASAAQKARGNKGLFDDLATDLDGLALPASFETSRATYETTWQEFDTVLENSINETVDRDALSSSYIELGTATELILRDNAAAEGDVGELLLLDVEDRVLEVMDGARAVMEAALVADVQWTTFEAAADISLPELILDWYGETTDDRIDEVLDRNPDFIDLLVIPVGAAIVLPGLPVSIELGL